MEPEPEPAFFDPTGAGAGSGSGLSLKRAFLTVESTYLESRYVECTLCKNYVQKESKHYLLLAPGDPCMKQFSEKKQGTEGINF